MIMPCPGGIVKLAYGKRMIQLDGFGSAAFLCDDSGTRRVSVDGQESVVRLADSTGKDRIVCNGQTGALGLRSDQGKNRVVFDSGLAYGAFGGSGHDGGLALFPAAATDLYTWSQATITLNAQAAAIRVGNITIDGSAGAISASGQTIAGASQANQQRSKSLPLSKQSIPLFPLGQAGAYIVELAACYGQPDNGGQRFAGFSYRRWAVFTYKQMLSHGDQFNTVELGTDEEAWGGVDDYQSSANTFWTVTGSTISPDKTNTNVLLLIPDLANPPNNVGDGTATLSVKVLFGSPPNF